MDDFRLEISAIQLLLRNTSHCPVGLHQYIKQDVNTSREQREKEEWREEKKKKKKFPVRRSRKLGKLNPVVSLSPLGVLMKSIRDVFAEWTNILSRLPINYCQHEKLPVDVRRSDSPRGIQMFWRRGSTHFSVNKRNEMLSHAASVRGLALW